MMADSIQPQSEIDMKDPREYIILAGTPVTVHYTDGRQPNNTTLDFHYRLESKQIHGDGLGPGRNYIAVCDVSKSVDAYVVKSDDILLIETEAV